MPSKFFPILLLTIIIFSGFVFSSVVLAQGTSVGESSGGTSVGEGTKIDKADLPNAIGSDNLSEVISKVIRIFLGIIGSISLAIFVYAGIVVLISRGNPTAIKKGLDTILWASLGIILTFSSYIILKFVFSVVGL